MRSPAAFPHPRIGRFSIGLAAAVLAAASLLTLLASPAAAFDLFGTHEVTAHFATSIGKPMADAEVRVFAPGEPETPVETGRTDAAGKFVFETDRDGMWSAEARTPGEIVRVMIRVGGGTAQRPKVNPLFVIGGLAVLFGALFWYRLRQLRRAPKR